MLWEKTWEIISYYRVYIRICVRVGVITEYSLPQSYKLAVALKPDQSQAWMNMGGIQHIKVFIFKPLIKNAISVQPILDAFLGILLSIGLWDHINTTCQPFLFLT